MTKRLPIVVLMMAMLAAGLFVTTTVRPARACAEAVSRITYASRTGCDVQVWVMNADGSGATAVSIRYTEVSRPVWNADQTKLTFAAETVSGRNIVVMDADGSNLVQLTNDDFSIFNDTPVFTPDGSSVMFTSDRAGNRQLWTIPATGGTPTQLTAYDDDLQPEQARFSPDGTHIVFRAIEGSGSNLFLANADGTGLRRLTSSGHEDQYPSFSPDGTQIAFGRGVGSGSNIWVMAADGTGARQIETTHCQWNSSPAWSPDASHLAYASNDGTSFRIMSVSVSDPTDVTELRSLAGSNLYVPSWGALVTATTTPSTTDAPAAVPAFTC